MITSLYMEHNLPFIKMRVTHNNKTLMLNKVLVDTGSASTILKTEIVETIGIKPADDDIIGTISGVGGTETVYSKKIDKLSIDDLHIEKVEVDIGLMDYGFDFDGIVGMDILIKIKSIIDLREQKLFIG
ncbi:MAG TPA: retropepsin-like aspartic protease [Bacillota bacterium]|nr:retropepsin-like aspartic protease [Bacillota bacterium]